MEAVAKLKNCPMSPRKMRLVIDNIRGKKVDHALSVLKYTKREGATWVEKLLLSAINNWEQHNSDQGLSASDFDLFIKEVRADEGIMLKRFRPAPYGRAHRIRKRRTHVTLVVENALPTESIENEQVIAE